MKKTLATVAFAAALCIATVAGAADLPKKGDPAAPTAAELKVGAGGAVQEPTNDEKKQYINPSDVLPPVVLTQNIEPAKTTQVPAVAPPATQTAVVVPPAALPEYPTPPVAVKLAPTTLPAQAPAGNCEVVTNASIATSEELSTFTLPPGLKDDGSTYQIEGPVNAKLWIARDRARNSISTDKIEACKDASGEFLQLQVAAIKGTVVLPFKRLPELIRIQILVGGQVLDFNFYGANNQKAIRSN